VLKPNILKRFFRIKHDANRERIVQAIPEQSTRKSINKQAYKELGKNV
jgi:hypothetical protein